MKLIIAGPPHSGKSVFISALMTAFQGGIDVGNTNQAKLFPIKLDATPDGETNFAKENYTDPELISRIRKKGNYTPKLREYIRRCVTNSNHPLMLIDIGGKFCEEDKEMLKGATHAIILSGGEIVSDEHKGENDFAESVRELTQFFDEMSVPVLASVYSDYDATQDYVMVDGTMAIHHLDRTDFAGLGLVNADAVAKRPNIKRIAQLICNELQKTGEYDALAEVSKNKESVWRSNNKVIFAGGYSAHKLAKLCIDELDSGGGGTTTEQKSDKQVTYFDAKLGEEIPIRGLDIGKTDRKWFDEPEFQGCYQGRRIYQIRTLSNYSQNILFPEDLANIETPNVPENCIVKIACGGSQWFGAIVAASYVHHCAAVAIYLPSQKMSAVIWSRDTGNTAFSSKSEATKLGKIMTCDENARLSADSKGVIADNPVVFIDMDGVIADFDAGVSQILAEHHEYAEQYKGSLKNMPGLFEKLPPVDGAIEGVKWLTENYNAFILTAAPWDNLTATQAKMDWIRKFFTDEKGFNPFKRKVIITHHKEQLIGDILIDDRNTNGVYEFGGEHIWFGSDLAGEKWKNWANLVKFLKGTKVTEK